MPNNDEFAVHRLNKRGLEMAEAVAELFATLLAGLDGIISVGRERSLVVTKLQEASLFAKRAVALDPVNQEQNAPPPEPAEEAKPGG